MLMLPTWDALWVGSTSSASTRCRLGLELRDILSLQCRLRKESDGLEDTRGVFCNQSSTRPRENAELKGDVHVGMTKGDHDARASIVELQWGKNRAASRKRSSLPAEAATAKES